jgi:hypothetical protein
MEHDPQTGLNRFTEDAALAMLDHRDLDAIEIERLVKDSHLMTSRKVMLAITRHVHTPRHVSIPLVRQLFVFELMQVALTPAIPADIKLLAEQCVVNKLASMTLGERLTLAKRGSTRMAAALLTDVDGRVRDAALNNPLMTEMWIVRALMKQGVPASFSEAVKRHPKWANRAEVRRAIEGITSVRSSTHQ